ncbi:zinc ribbon domain-containing protein [Candidatus Gracilibacteria bacterium]|nr:zinc ribbon domain-containing protein [Candidatus Gracilibacteria bacterium]
MQEIINILNNFLENIINFNYIGFLSNITSILTFETLLKLIVIYFFIVWFAIVIWVTKDIINRSNNILYQIFSILTVLVGTPLGIVVYLLIRPSKTLFEKYYEESSIEEVDEKEIDEILNKNSLKCFKCNFDINSDYKFCPNCKVNLKKECFNCKKELSGNFKYCPYCGVSEEEKNKKNKKNKKVEIDLKNEIINDITLDKS